MSSMRHDEGSTSVAGAPAPPAEPDVRSFAVTLPTGTVVLAQPPGWDRLLFAASGVLTVHTTPGTWVLPSDRAVWVPDGVEHQIETAGAVRMRSLYLRVGVVPDLGGCRAVAVTPLVRELVLEAVRRAPIWLDDDRDHRLVGLLVDQLTTLPVEPLQVRFPRDDRARSVADALVADPTGSNDLDACCTAAGASRRTVERRFRAETGLGLAEWRTRQRLAAAVRLMAEGATVTSVALAVGYATPSGFGAAFRRVLGTSPGRYVAAPPAAGSAPPPPALPRAPAGVVPG